MPLLFSQLVEVTRDKVKQDLLDLLNTLGFAATSWQDGSVPLALVELGAEIWSKLTSSAVVLRDMAFNDTSTGDALTRFSASHYANIQNPATTCQRNDTLTCASGQGPYTINLGAVVISDATGKTFRNVAGLGVVYPATLASGGALTMLFEAEVAGAASNIVNGQVTTIVTTLAGVTVTSDIKTRDGIDKESEPTLRTRNSTKWASLGVEAIKDGMVNAALKASPAVAQVGVDDNNPNGQGTVDVYLAGQTTTLSESDRLIVDPLLKKRVFGSTTLRTFAAPSVNLDLTGTVYFDATFTQAAVKAAVEAALVEFLKTIPLGGFKYVGGPQNVVPKNDIETVIKDTTVSALKAVKTVTLSIPSTDLAVSSFGKVIQGNWTTLVYTPVTSST